MIKSLKRARRLPYAVLMLLGFVCLIPNLSYALQATVVPGSAYTEEVKQLDVKALPETIQIEFQDRVNRIERLSRERGVPKPDIVEHLQVEPGALKGIGYPVPVIRIVYKDRSLFDFDRDEIRPDADGILSVIAETIKRDLPDTQLLVVGHTDSVGTDTYNDDLARRRAANVMRNLVTRGVPIEQLATAAVGERQPIATNATEEGRSVNRRVEFMISAFYEANTRLIEAREINIKWLNNHEIRQLEPLSEIHVTSEQRNVPVYRPTERMVKADNTTQAVHELKQVGTIKLREPRVIKLKEDM